MTDTYTIKPLEWRKIDGAIYANTPYHRYLVWDVVGECSAQILRCGASDGLGYHGTIEQAKAACEQHWHDTIKQALEEV